MCVTHELLCVYFERGIPWLHRLLDFGQSYIVIWYNYGLFLGLKSALQCSDVIFWMYKCSIQIFASPTILSPCIYSIGIYHILCIQPKIADIYFLVYNDPSLVTYLQWRSEMKTACFGVFLVRIFSDVSNTTTHVIQFARWTHLFM